MASRSARNASDYNVRAVERALQIMDCFGGEVDTRGITEIAEIVGLHKATVHRIVTTLVSHGYLERLPNGTEYRLGIRLAALGAQVIMRMDLRHEALIEMRQVVRACEESCDLGVFDHGDVLVIEIVRSPHGHALASAPWRKLPAHATASGKLFLAYLPDEVREGYLAQPMTAYTRGTITDPLRLREQLAQIRSQQYAVDDEEYEVGVRAVSAAICDQRGQMVAALSVPGPAGRLPPGRLPELAAVLMRGAMQIERRMGWRS